MDARPDIIYLDHNASTPVHPDVWKEMAQFASNWFYNPSGAHRGSLAVRERIRSSAEIVKAHLGAPAHEVVFTSGATEANNLALKGFHAGTSGAPLLVSPVEHKSVIAASEHLVHSGIDRAWLRIDGLGQVDLDDLEAKLRAGASLVSAMAVNNEVGSVAHTHEIARMCRDHGALFHCDATQAMDNVVMDLAQTSIDLLSFSAHKIHGPKGAGCLLVGPRAMERFRGPHMHGGAQQSGLRAGTENVPGIIGLAKAVELCARDFDRNMAHRRAMRDRLLAGLRARCDFIVNGDPERRHPGNLHVSFAGVSPQRLFSRCSRIAFSTGAACNSATGEPSHVLKCMGISPERIKSSMRLSVGAATTVDEIDAAIEIIASAQSSARA